MSGLRYPNTPGNETDNTTFGAEITAADTTDKIDVVEAASGDTSVIDLVAVSSCTEDEALGVYIVDGTNVFQLGTVSVPALSGTDGTTPSVSLLNTTDMPFLAKRDDQSFPIASGQKIQVASIATIADGAIRVLPFVINYLPQS